VTTTPTTSAVHASAAASPNVHRRSSSSPSLALILAIAGLVIAALGVGAWKLVAPPRRRFGSPAGAAPGNLSDAELTQLAETVTGLTSRIDALAGRVRRDLPAGEISSQQAAALAAGEPRRRTAR
jgi:hypothetical protein